MSNRRSHVERNSLVPDANYLRAGDSLGGSRAVDARNFTKAIEEEVKRHFELNSVPADVVERIQNLKRLAEGFVSAADQLCEWLGNEHLVEPES
jgi:hypothetical protein